MGRKLGRLCPFGGGGGGSPSKTMWPGPRPTCMPSFVLIHPTVWPQYTNVTDRQDRQTDNGPILYSKPLKKRSPKKYMLVNACVEHVMNMHDAACPAGLSPAQSVKHVKPMMTVVEEQTRPAPLQQTTTVSTHALTAVTTKYTRTHRCDHYVHTP